MFPLFFFSFKAKVCVRNSWRIKVKIFFWKPQDIETWKGHHVLTIIIWCSVYWFNQTLTELVWKINICKRRQKINYPLLNVFVFVAAIQNLVTNRLEREERKKHLKSPTFNSPSMKIYNTHKLNDLPAACKHIFCKTHTHTHTNIVWAKIDVSKNSHLPTVISTPR